jgi:uncharacterized OB-fold protein
MTTQPTSITAEFDVHRWAAARSLPRPGPLTRPFWDALTAGTLLVQRCQACAHWVFRPEVACTRCLSPELTWTESTGRGTLHTFSVVHRGPHRDIATPYIVGVVRLEEGWHMMTNVIGCHPDAVHTGMQLRLRAETVDGLSVPFFEPDGPGQ